METWRREAHLDYTVHVVCNNTLSCAYLADSKGVVKVRHDTQFDPDKVGLDLEIFQGSRRSFKLKCDALRPRRSIRISRKRF